MDLYNKLPKFTGPNMLPPEQMAHFRDNIRPNMQYCGLFIVPRLTPWCTYIREYDAKMKSFNKSVQTGPSSQIQNISGPHSIIKAINDDGCYDTYNCDVPQLAGAIHSLMMAVIIIVTIGLISNMYCLVKMYMNHNRAFIRNSFGLNMALLIICDCLHLLLSLLLFVIPPLVSYKYEPQLRFYQRTTIILVPWLLPLWDFSNMIVTWIIISMLIQRSNITRSKLLLEAGGEEFLHISQQPHMNGKDWKRTLLRMLALVAGLFVVTVPKFAEYTFNYDFNTDKGIIVPLLRVIKLYRLIMLKMLYPSIECTVPILLMLAYIIAIKYHETILMRSRLEKDLTSNERNSIIPQYLDEERNDDDIEDDSETKVSTHCDEALLANNNTKSQNRSSLTFNINSTSHNLPHQQNNCHNCNYNNAVNTLSNMKVFSVAGVSKKTQLVIWTSTVVLFDLTMKLSAMIVAVERTLEGSPKEQWPQLRQIIKTTSIVFSILTCAVKPLIYIHCCPRLLRRDLSKGLFDKSIHNKINDPINLA